LWSGLQGFQMVELDLESVKLTPADQQIWDCRVCGLDDLCIHLTILLECSVSKLTKSWQRLHWNTKTIYNLPLPLPRLKYDPHISTLWHNFSILYLQPLKITDRL
jgi:hypothetical protein